MARDVEDGLEKLLERVLPRGTERLWSNLFTRCSRKVRRTE